MDEINFKIFLEERYTKKSVSSRLSRAKKGNGIVDFDMAVQSDENMKKALLELQKFDNREQNFQNSLRKYYEFVNHREFPKLNNIF